MQAHTHARVTGSFFTPVSTNTPARVGRMPHMTGTSTPSQTPVLVHLLPSGGLGGGACHTRRLSAKSASSSRRRNGFRCNSLMGNNEGDVKEVELGSPSWAKLSSTHIPGIIEQVEGTYEAEVAKTELPTDPLLLELYERRKELYQTDTKWRLMAKLGVDCCFRDVGVEPLRRMERDSIRRVMKTVEVDIQRLRSVHSEEAQELLSRHIKNTTRDTEPIVVGSYQIRMPPMIGRGDISIPFLFLEQVYSNAIVFGFCLGRAEKRCQLENSLMPAAASATFDE
eukprot:CAMPEP_0198211952 /NCGR_PEP_ID=MMETSP1445-20131203/25438_1 /TAXON_ID=36898 /ORGANISM="Pyramimonas sp., Strain CCMP2087" /LENGTH=281 /DNA_ID=CAMNT_0043886313 /DNA_START=228 /DNA_END=1070 /DNA_ORIENTATION=+